MVIYYPLRSVRLAHYTPYRVLSYPLPLRESLRHSSGKLKFPSSQPMLIPHRPP